MKKLVMLVFFLLFTISAVNASTCPTDYGVGAHPRTWRVLDAGTYGPHGQTFNASGTISGFKLKMVRMGNPGDIHWRIGTSFGSSDIASGTIDSRDVSGCGITVNFPGVSLPDAENYYLWFEPTSGVYTYNGGYVGNWYCLVAFQSVDVYPDGVRCDSGSCPPQPGGNSDYYFKIIGSNSVESCEDSLACESCPSYAGNSPPSLNVNFNKDFFEQYSEEDWVKYSDIFPTNLEIIFDVYDPDIDDTQFDIFVQISGGTGVSDFPTAGTKSCTRGEECKIVFDEDYIMPGDTITVQAMAFDDSGAASAGKTVSIVIPTFDLQVKDIKLINVLEDVPLVADKPVMARVWVNYNSNLIDELDKDVKISLAYQGTTHEETIRPKNYPPLADLKQNPLGTFLNQPAVSLMQEIKDAEDSANFVDLGRVLSPNMIQATAVVDSSSAIKESDETNNEKTTQFQGRRQKKMFRLMVVNVETIPFDGTYEDYQRVPVIAQGFYGYMLERLPLVRARTRLEYRKEFEYIDFKQKKLDKDKYGYPIELRKKIYNKLERYAIKNNIDLVIGMVMREEVMWFGEEQPSPAEGTSMRGKFPHVILINAKETTLDPTTALHEFAHVFLDLPDDYTGLSRGTLSSNGWLLKQTLPYGTDEPKIDVWNIEPVDGFASLEDRPEHDIGLFGIINLGLRFFDILGNAPDDNIWISKDKHLRFLEELTE